MAKRHAPAQPLRSGRWDTGHYTMHARYGGVTPAHPAPAVVLLHGLVISSSYMVPLAKRLAPHYPVFAPDMPGFGLSEKPGHTLDLSELADALHDWMAAVGLVRAVLFGNSMGCQIAVEMAVRHPERVCGLLLQGPTVDPAARSARQQILRLLRNSSREPSPGIAPLVDYARAGLRRALRTFRYALADPIELKLPRVSVPTLVIRGEQDPVVPQDWAEQVTRLLPEGRLVVIPGTAHTLNYFAALDVMRVSRPLLESVACPSH